MPNNAETMFTCQECGHEWTDTMPLFGKYYSCKQQGCRGTAKPADDLPPTGIEPIDSSNKTKTDQ